MQILLFNGDYYILLDHHVRDNFADPDSYYHMIDFHADSSHLALFHLHDCCLGTIDYFHKYLRGCAEVVAGTVDFVGILLCLLHDHWK